MLGMDFNCNGDAVAAAVGPNRRCATVTLKTAGAAAVVDRICDRDIFCKTKGVERFVAIHGALRGVGVTKRTAPPAGFRPIASIFQSAKSLFGR